MLRPLKSQNSLIKNFLLCSLSALLLIFSFPDLNLWILAWFAFVPLFLAVKDQSQKRAFLLSYLSGVIFWWGTIYWLVHVTLIGTIILILYLALYFGLFGLFISSVLRRESSFAHFLLVPSFWVILEYVRGHLFTGFPWALLGYSQYLNLPVIQVSDITGAWGVSFLVMTVNTLIYSVVGCQLSVVNLARRIIFVALLVSFVLGYGYFKLSQEKSEAGKGQPIRVSVIQGDIPQEMKWSPAYQGFILGKYLELSTLAAQEKPDLIVWPEAAAPGILGEDNWVFDEIFSFASGIQVPLVVGSVVEEKGRYFGSALFISAEGKVLSRYDKIHRVPFGEYVPLKKIFPFLASVVPIGDIDKGKEFTVFSLRRTTSRLRGATDIKFAVLDCFEDLFPELSSEFVGRGADFLINITNDAWYKKTSAPLQHLQASVFRAVENRVPLARSANTGVSGFIRSSGKVSYLCAGEGCVKIFVPGHKTEELTLALRKKKSFYTRFPDAFILFCAFCFVYDIIMRLLKQKE